MRSPTVVALAHAKVNLDLRVLGSRADGFHELRTVFQSIELHDRLTCIGRRGPFAIRCRTPGVPLDETNLVWRAAQSLWSTLGREGTVRDVSVRLQKQIPMQSGLGGGSADAAAALAALGRLWGVRPTLAELRDIAAPLGADVSFFLSGGTALGLGRGDEIYPLVDLPPHWVVLIMPLFGVSTSEAYAWYDEERGSGLREAEEFQVLPVPWPSRAARMVNDLEGPIARRHAEIGVMKASLRETGALAAAMSGSGSAVFGLFRSKSAAQAAVPALSRSGWRVFLTRTLTRTEYGRRSRAVRVGRRGLP